MAELMLRRERLTVAEAYFERYKVYGQETSESLWLGYKIKRSAAMSSQLRTTAASCWANFRRPQRLVSI